MTGASGANFPPIPNPTKGGYVFSGWNPALPTTITGNATFDAQWNTGSSQPQQPSGGSSGGGGGGSLPKDKCPNGDTSASYYDGKCSDSEAPGTGNNDALKKDGGKKDEGEKKDDGKKKDEGGKKDDGSKTSEEAKKELAEAYERAYGLGITTMSGMENAKLGEFITRAELAKMMSVYATKVLGRDRVITGVANYPDMKKVPGDLPEFVQKAYQMQIMGIHHDGSQLSLFEPYSRVTRAEFAAVLSRVLWGSEYNKAGPQWYERHLEALKKQAVLTDTNPLLQERRGWIILMLKRSQAIQ